MNLTCDKNNRQKIIVKRQKKLSCFFPSDFIEGQEEDSVLKDEDSADMDEEDYENEGIIM